LSGIAAACGYDPDIAAEVNRKASILGCIDREISASGNRGLRV